MADFLQQPRQVGRSRGSGLDVFDVSRGARSLGLLGIRERALLVGGEIVVRGAEGKGTNVVVRVPVASGIADCAV